MGDATIGAQNGFGFDFRATQKITRHAFNPQITYGFVYQPDLTNLAVVSVGIALRPSRPFSIDLNTYAYAQVSKQVTKPSAHISGPTTGHSSFLDAEVSLIGSWRPMKKMKVEFGAGGFHAGSAYHASSTLV